MVPMPGAPTASVMHVVPMHPNIPAAGATQRRALSKRTPQGVAAAATKGSVMSASTVGILLSAATLTVVAAASVAAIVQLNYLRAGNQLNALLEILNQWNLPAVQAALSELHAIPEKMKDPKYVTALQTPALLERSKYLEFLALDVWEQIGAYSKYRLIDESILLDITASQVRSAWKSAAPAMAIIRKGAGPAAFENFEYLAVRAMLWERRYPNGTYPARLARMSELGTAPVPGDGTVLLVVGGAAVSRN